MEKIKEGLDIFIYASGILPSAEWILEEERKTLEFESGEDSNQHVKKNN